MRESFGTGGSTFIKLGQWISMRSDIFPISVCEELAHLRQSAPEHSFEETLRVIEKAFGKPANEVFARLYTHAVASGSIAQVHKGLFLYFFF